MGVGLLRQPVTDLWPLHRVDLDEVRRRLRYDPVEGSFTWIVNTNGHQRPGHEAGSVNKKGYRYIYLERKLVRASRLAWALVHNEWPDFEIDHINGNKTDDRIANLRLATKQQNSFNAVRRVGRSGYRGVTRTSKGTRWIASMRIDGVRVCLGVFDTPEEASVVYEAKATKLHGEYYGRGAPTWRWVPEKKDVTK